MKKRVFYKAFGESKIVTDWAKDIRCNVSMETFFTRIKRGWNIEDAITRSKNNWHKPVLGEIIEAWGEKKSIEEWTKDVRCKIKLATSLKRRLDKGMRAEEAISKITYLEYTFLGESKNLFAWSKDLRCAVPYTCLWERINVGISFEEAFSKPINFFYDKIRIKCFGEEKSPEKWGRDNRCTVSASIIRARLFKGWSSELAITTPKSALLIKAWGELKTVSAWTKDIRFKGKSSRTITNRILNGMSAEDAISLPRQKAISNQTLITAWGESKNSADWARDFRCAGIQHDTIRWRIREMNWPAEKAISFPARSEIKPSDNFVYLTIWGETKHIAAWLRDSRCKIITTTLYARLKNNDYLMLEDTLTFDGNLKQLDKNWYVQEKNSPSSYEKILSIVESFPALPEDGYQVF
jgi:hypothetical protein